MRKKHAPGCPCCEETITCLSCGRTDMPATLALTILNNGTGITVAGSITWNAALLGWQGTFTLPTNFWSVASLQWAESYDNCAWIGREAAAETCMDVLFSCRTATTGPKVSISANIAMCHTTNINLNYRAFRFFNPAHGESCADYVRPYTPPTGCSSCFTYTFGGNSIAGSADEASCDPLDMRVRVNSNPFATPSGGVLQFPIFFDINE